MSRLRARGGLLVLLLILLAPTLALAQDPAPPTPAPEVQDDDPDRDLNVSQPDFTVITLPTTLRLPRYKSAFRVTHRFHRSFRQGDAGDFVDSFFGIDNGASIGLEYRFGVMRGLQAGITRTNDRTINLFSQYNVWQQSSGRLVGLNLLASMDGDDNFSDDFSPVVGLAISRELGRHGAVYFDPTWVHNANHLDASDEDNDSFVAGVGLRLRIRPTLYLVGEIMPRFGYKPGVNQMAAAFEKRAGGHSFQINVSNGFQITPGQTARGGISNDDWYVGFNITRKFF